MPLFAVCGTGRARRREVWTAQNVPLHMTLRIEDKREGLLEILQQACVGVSVSSSVPECGKRCC